ncbi:acyltransferase family protein [Microbacterium gubbeenense]|uniref:acyltransferase family protein n=1 Tax=Microbacterium gubbeenense TaxID=159896 RepID=UPI00041877B1|nr:acyltransferase family protein [Microbacterium gubbeenense]
MTPHAQAVEPRERLAWVDAARALCVLAVVILHATISLLMVFEPDPLDMAWRHIVDAMTPFRMPALSLLSGMLLSSRISAGFGDRRAVASIALSAWLYIVWLAVFLVVALTVGSSIWLGQFGFGKLGDSLASFVDQLVLPRTVLWYVAALAIWSAILAAIRRVPPAAVLIVLSALSIVSFSLPTDGAEQYPNMIRYFVFFAVGVYAAEEIRSTILRSPWATGIIAAGVFVATTLAASFGPNERVDDVLSVPRDVAGALIVMVLAVALCRVPGVGRGLAWVGRRTLPIYVMHAILLDLLVMGTSWWVDLFESRFARTIAPVVIMLAITAVAVAVHWLALRTPAHVLFVLPVAWRRRILKEPR